MPVKVMTNYLQKEWYLYRLWLYFEFSANYVKNAKALIRLVNVANLMPAKHLHIIVVTVSHCHASITKICIIVSLFENHFIMNTF